MTRGLDMALLAACPVAGCALHGHCGDSFFAYIASVVCFLFAILFLLERKDTHDYERRAAALPARRDALG